MRHPFALPAALRLVAPLAAALAACSASHRDDPRARPTQSRRPRPQSSISCSRARSSPAPRAASARRGPASPLHVRRPEDVERCQRPDRKRGPHRRRHRGLDGSPASASPTAQRSPSHGRRTTRRRRATSYSLPRDVTALDAFNRKYDGRCGRSQHGAENFWHDFKPGTASCALDDADVLRLRATVTAHAKADRKYPEYRRIWEDGPA